MCRNFPSEFQKIFKEEISEHNINASREEKLKKKQTHQKTNQFHESNKLQSETHNNSTKQGKKGVFPLQPHIQQIHAHTHTHTLES